MPHVPLTPERLAALPPDPLVDEAWYHDAYPDTRASELSAWQHFIIFGDAEGRRPNAEFDVDFYRTTYMPLGERSPGFHYIRHGRAMGYQTARFPRTAEASRLAMLTALRRRRFPVVLIGNDAQRAGAPLLLQNIASHLRVRGYAPVFLLGRGGPQLPVFQGKGPTFVLAEGWDVTALGDAMGPDVPVLGNTGWAAPVLAALRAEGPQLLLIHEMTAYLDEHDLLQPLAGIENIAVSMPSMQQSLAGAIGRPRDDILVIRPGLTTPHPRADDVASVRTQVSGRVYLGAGYADHRKGFDRFCDAALAIRAIDPTATFAWLGEMNEWAHAHAARIRHVGVRLLTPGFRDDAAAWYAAASCYLLTSRQDPGPTTCMDAARIGLGFVGYAADVGLVSVPEIDRIGEFVPDDDVDALAQAAFALASRETDVTRRRRRRLVRLQTSFARYIDHIMEHLDTPRAPFARDARAHLSWARSVKHVAHMGLIEANKVSARIAGLAEPAPLTLTPVVGPWVQRRRSLPIGLTPPLSVCVHESLAPDRALYTPEEVAALEPGSRVWLADLSLLPHLPSPAHVHLVRTPGTPHQPWLGAVAAISPMVVCLTQIDPGKAPRWVRTRAAPPRAHWPARTPAPAPRPTHLTLAAQVPGLRVGVFLHAFHLDLVGPLLAALTWIPAAGVHVSTDTAAKAAVLSARLPTADVRVFPNRGRDIHPKVFGFAAEHAHYDVVAHLHTKRSPHSADLGPWSSHILERLVGSRARVSSILAAFATQPDLGMVSPMPYPRILPSYGWTENRPLAELLTWGRGWHLPDPHHVSFPAGSMFWARPQALAAVQALALTADDFLDGANLGDGTVAHAVERLLGASCAQAGLHQRFVD